MCAPPRALPPICSRALSCTLRAPRSSTACWPPTRIPHHALLSTRQNANALSAANKLLIRCAWAGTSASASAGYGSSWAPGTCRATFTSKAILTTAVRAFDADVDSAIATYGPVADWGVSAVSDMSGLFSGLGNFNANVSSWDTSGVTDMSYMFSGSATGDGATAFNQPLSFDTSSVTDMEGMFAVRFARALLASSRPFPTAHRLRRRRRLTALPPPGSGPTPPRIPSSS